MKIVLVFTLKAMYTIVFVYLNILSVYLFLYYLAVCLGNASQISNGEK